MPCKAWLLSSVWVLNYLDFNREVFMLENRAKLQFKDQKILVTGGAGFLGKQVIAQLIARGASPDLITVPRSKEFDLRS